MQRLLLIRNSLRVKRQCFDKSTIQRTIWPGIKALKAIEELGQGVRTLTDLIVKLENKNQIR
jgi:hypothetical protein